VPADVDVDVVALAEITERFVNEALVAVSTNDSKYEGEYLAEAVNPVRVSTTFAVSPTAAM